MYKLYIQNKRNYLQLQQLHNQFNNQQFGGVDSDMMPTYDDIKLSDLVGDVGKITKLGSFRVKDHVVIGDTDYDDIDLTSGTYTAYFLADSLMIINDALKINPKTTNVQDWIWTHAGTGVGVDSGQFGFYDSYAINFINKTMIKDDSFSVVPYFKCDKKDKNDPAVNIDASIVDGSCVHDIFEKMIIEDDIKNLEPFGVISTTTTGDGGFECFVIDRQRAILLGGKAGGALVSREDKAEAKEKE